MEKISVPVRIFAVVIVLVGMAGMLAMRTMGPSDEPVAVPPSATPAPAAAKPKPAAAKPKPAPVAAKPKPAPTPAPAADPEPAVNAVRPELPETGFPKVVDRALARHEVVVLSLVVPGARVDELAAAEAEAGAKLGGAGFLALDVLDEGTARSLLTKLENVRDPSVLVVKRSGEIALELRGFVDRETVAQAAANASS
jgi:outer membrane biosynthesis protein TonB